MGRVGEILKSMVAGKRLVRNLTLLLAMILVFMIYQRVYILPKKERITVASGKVLALSKEVNALQTRVDEERTRATREAEILDSYRRLSEQLKSAKRMLPTQENIAELLDNLTAPGTRAGVSIMSLQPFPPEEKPSLTRLTFKLQLEGRYRNIGRYLQELENMDRLIMVDNIQLTTSESGDLKIQAQLLVSTYLLKEDL